MYTVYIHKYYTVHMYTHEYSVQYYSILVFFGLDRAAPCTSSQLSKCWMLAFNEGCQDQGHPDMIWDVKLEINDSKHKTVDLIIYSILSQSARSMI